MDVTGKSQNSSISIRYSINEEKLEEIFSSYDDDPPTPQNDNSPITVGDGSPRKTEKGSILEKYFKSAKLDKIKSEAKPIDDGKQVSESVASKNADESGKSTPAKDVSASPMKDVLNRLSKRANSSDVGDAVNAEPPTETWKIFHDFKYKLAQAVEEIKSSRTGDTQTESKDKVGRDNSISDSEENSLAKECDQQSLADTDNQVSSLESSMQNLSEIALPGNTKPGEVTFTLDKNESSESNDDTQKNMDMDVLANKEMDDSLMDVESGVEALEENNVDNPDNTDSACAASRTCAQYPIYADKDQLIQIVRPGIQKTVKFFLNPFFLTCSAILVLSILVFSEYKLWLGFVMGLWLVSLVNCIKYLVLSRFSYVEDASLTEQLFSMINLQRNVSLLAMPNIKEHKPIKKLEGWINQYRFPEYDPVEYHIRLTTTVFMKLEGQMLRISYTHTKVPKKALWNEQIEVSNFYQHRIYDLSRARVILLPKGIVAKRLWSKKYPICIILNPAEQVQILEKESQEKKPNDVDKNKTGGSVDNSPTMKKKFIWKLPDRKARASQTDSPEHNREGLRRRISRRLHKDKKQEEANVEIKEAALSYEESSSSQKAENESIEEVTRTARINFDENTDVAEVAKLTELLEDAETDSGSNPPDSPPAQEQWTYVKKYSEDVNALFLFARTGREKFDWYIQIKKSIIECQEQETPESTKESPQSEQVTYDANLMEMTVIKPNDKEGNASNEKTKSSETNSPQHLETQKVREEKIDDSNFITYEKDFWTYMYKIMQAPKPGPSIDDTLTVSPEAPWLNLVVARIAYDAVRSPYWMRRLQDRIQRKLETLRLPSFMSPLVVTELDGGEHCPMVRGITGPRVDERGVWIQLDVNYTGTATITIVSQLNLMKLKDKKLPEDDIAYGSDQSPEPGEGEVPHHIPVESTSRESKIKMAIFNADVDDSAESSSDDESIQSQALISDIPPDAAVNNETGPPHPSSTKRFLKIVDKITSSKYFQHISDYKYVKRAMEGLSNTDIKLTLELKALSGILAVNIPPPPHDRIWIGFRSNPHMWLKARPGVGSLALRFTHITSLIENKLCKEFEKVLVMPNMEDFTIDYMTPTPVDYE